MKYAKRLCALRSAMLAMYSSFIDFSIPHEWKKKNCETWDENIKRKGSNKEYIVFCDVTRGILKPSKS